MTASINVYKLIGVKKFIPGIAWFFLSLIAISIPGYDLPKVGSWFEQISFDKLVHTGLFGMLSVLFMYPVAKSMLSRREKINWYIKVALATVLWGFATELIQKYFIPGRSYDLIDFLADTLGGICAFLLFRLKFVK
jgi:VanZ family protein